MTRDELFAIHDDVSARAKGIMQKKNQDYGRESDPLHNFRRHGLKGFVVRMDDKMARLDSFVEKGFMAVQDESAEDTLIDLLNYSVLMLAMIREQRPKVHRRPEPADYDNCDHEAPILRRRREEDAA
jgi:hypothetical protein